MSYKNPNTMGGSFAYYEAERRTRKSIFFKPMDWNPIEKELKTFGSLKRWFGSGTTQLKGKNKVHYPCSRSYRTQPKTKSRVGGYNWEIIKKKQAEMSKKQSRR